jgi:antitoxin component YwqK of YwqJK toxin-antitoxin module
MTFEEIDNLMKNEESLMFATNEDKETVVIQYNRARTMYTITTYQKNGWTRITIYYKDGTIDTDYRRTDSVEDRRKEM